MVSHVYHNTKHDIDIFYHGQNEFTLVHGEEIITKAPAELVRKMYNNIVNFHNKAGINYEEEK